MDLESTDMLVERVPLDSITPDPANVRLHSDTNLDAIKGSLARFGQQKPIVVDQQGLVRAGNGTLLASSGEGHRGCGPSLTL